MSMWVDLSFEICLFDHAKKKKKKKKNRLPEVVVCMCNKTLCEVSKHLSINGRKKKPRKAEIVAVVILENCQEKISGNFIFL